MATTYNHVQIGVVDANGDVNVLYPVSTGEDVSVDSSTNKAIPSSVTSVQKLVDAIGAMAFNDGSDLIYLSGNSEDYSGDLEGTEIHDNDESYTSAWSSKKMNTHMERFFPTYENTADIINYLPVTAARKVINGTDINYQKLCPTTGYIWFVEYVPYVISADTTAGSAGAPNTVEYAIERWVGHAFKTHDEEPVVYERIYMNSSWSSFHKVAVSFG